MIKPAFAWRRESVGYAVPLRMNEWMGFITFVKAKPNLPSRLNDALANCTCHWRLYAVRFIKHATHFSVAAFFSAWSGPSVWVHRARLNGDAHPPPAPETRLQDSGRAPAVILSVLLLFNMRFRFGLQKSFNAAENLNWNIINSNRRNKERCFRRVYW